MIKVIAQKQTVLSTNENKILLEILVSLEKIKFSQDIFKKLKMSEHQKQINTLNIIGFLYEAIKTFDKIKGAARETIQVCDNSKVKSAFDILCSKDTKIFKERILGKLRNKAAFHIDEVVINNFFETFDNNNPEEIELWVQTDSGDGYSPLVNKSLNLWYMTCLEDGDIIDNVFKWSEVSNSIFIVTDYLLKDWFKADIINE